MKQPIIKAQTIDSNWLFECYCQLCWKFYKNQFFFFFCIKQRVFIVAPEFFGMSGADFLYETVYDVMTL